MLVQSMKAYEGSDAARTIELWFQANEISKSHFAEEWIYQRRRLYGLASWVYQKLVATEGEERGDEVGSRRADLYTSIKPDIDAIYEEKVVYPSANFCLDFEPGDRIVST
jgi:hypothetical protein